MFYRLWIALIGIFITIMNISDVGAFSVSYEPAETILMTGATSSARFDVMGILVSTYGATGAELRPRFQTGSMSFTGIFYLSGSIGWVAFHSGTEYQVYLHCGMQSLSNLSTPCNLTGTGWSEVVGDVIFDNIEYIPTLGELSGSVSTYAGDFSLSGISLPIRAVTLNEDIDTLTTSHNTVFTIKEQEKYGDSWHPKPINIQPVSSTYNQDYAINSVDLSLASNYEFTITDPSGSKTRISGVTVYPNGISKTLESGNFFITHYCSSFPASCPDGLSPTELSKTNPANPLADGSNFYEFHLKLRDKYGNKINTGSVAISYTGTVSSIRDESPILLTPYTNVGYDGLVFSGALFIPDFNGSWDFSESTFLGQEIRYGLASLSPTDASHEVMLNTITYTAPDGTKTTVADTTAISFDPAFTLTANPPTNIQVGTGNVLSFSYGQSTAELGLNPELIIFLPIGIGVNARWIDVETPGMKHEPSNPADLDANLSDIYNSSWGKWVSPSSGYLTITGTYSPYSAYPSIESIAYEAYIHYTGKDNIGSPIDVLYPIGNASFGTSTYQVSKVKILGQNNARSEYGTIGTEKVGKTKLLDTIRKNTALLSRNRSNSYNNTPYLIKNGDITITGGTFDDKKTIVAVGGNITISENIGKQLSPLAVIVLSDSEGNGGDIFIAPTVTDIHASLISEHSILSNNPTINNYQLYIYGSVVSANTLGDTAAKICPYYISTTCNETEAAKYDLEMLRSGFDGSNNASISQTATKFLESGVVIEYDTRIQHDPPPILH